MPHLVPRGSLTDEQNQHLLTILENPNQSFWMSGFAGSGKTVLLYYALKDIKEKGQEVSFATFTHTLLRLFSTITAELGVDGVFHNTIYQYFHYRPPTEVLICDEIQDFSRQMIDQINAQRIRVIAGGDGNQSIYKTDPIYESQIMPSPQSMASLNTRELKLTINLRLPAKVIRAINKMLGSNGMWQGADGTKEGTLSYFRGDTTQDEVAFLLNDAKLKTQQAGKTVAILFPTKADLIEFCQIALQNQGMMSYDAPYRFNDFTNHLNQHGIPVEILVNRDGNLNTAQQNRKVVLMTMHGSKGLDFDCVMIPFFSFNYNIYPVHPELDKTLLMVAMSRTKNDLIFSYSGSAHSKLQLLIDSGLCEVMIDPNAVTSNDNEITIDF